MNDLESKTILKYIMKNKKADSYFDHIRFDMMKKDDQLFIYNNFTFMKNYNTRAVYIYNKIIYNFEFINGTDVIKIYFKNYNDKYCHLFILTENIFVENNKFLLILNTTTINISLLDFSEENINKLKLITTI